MRTKRKHKRVEDYALEAADEEAAGGGIASEEVGGGNW